MTLQNSRTWAEIHMDRLEHNYRTLRAPLAPGVKFLGVVKANAYGHGAVPVAYKLQELGADYLAVACLSEAIELREVGISLPILILGYTDPSFTEELIHYGITQCLYNAELAEGFSAAAVKAGGTLKVHLKADTGMSRLGFLANESGCADAAAGIAAAARLPGLEPEGLFMHFSDADTCPEYSEMQIARYGALCEELESKWGLTFPIRHCAASAATFFYPEAHFNMVRPGIVLYGHHPDKTTVDCADLQPVMEVKSRVASVKAMPKGTCVSYGRTYTLERDSVIAAVPIGYADGLHRTLSGKLEMLIHGKRVSQIGRICMDMCMVDVTDLEGVRIGDEVTLFGSQDGAELPLEEMAQKAGTITYELLCAVAPRVPRLYL